MTNDATPMIEPRRERPMMTAREKRQRILLLIVLLIVLAFLAAATYFWVRNRSIPVPQLARGSEMLPPPQYLFSITGSGANFLEKPVGVDVSDDGRVYVVDFGKRRISVFTSQGRFLSAFNKTPEGDLRNPVHLQIVNDEVWVTDRRLRGLYVFDLEGKFKRSFLPKGEEKFKWTPLALAFDKDGSLRVTDVGNTKKHRLLYFSLEGSRTAAIGKTAQVDQLEANPGQFYFPNGLAVSDDGRVYVADGDNRRIQVFNDKGEFDRFIDTSGVPRGLAIDEKQRLYVVDALAHTVDVYDLEGERLTQFGERGFGPGQFNFPNDVALDGRGRIYITDRENNQVQVWGWPAVIVPPNVTPTAPWQWALCLLPLLLLPLLLRRRRKFVLTPQFFEAIVASEQAEALRARRLELIVANIDRPLFEGLPLFTDYEDAFRFEDYSESDVAALKDRLRCTEREAIYLTMGDRARGVLSEDIDLRRLGLTVRVRVLDVDEFVSQYGDSGGSRR